MKEKTPTTKEVVYGSLSKGWKVAKKISSAGFLSSSTYDNRTVYNREDLKKLLDEGFFLDQDLGTLALNILLRL